jgi:hypothetical protein
MKEEEDFGSASCDDRMKLCNMIFILVEKFLNE